MKAEQRRQRNCIDSMRVTGFKYVESIYHRGFPDILALNIIKSYQVF